MGPRRRAAAAVVGAAALLVNTACYGYLPPTGVGVPAQGDARIELTADGSAAMQSAVGPRIRIIEGHIRGVDSSGTATVDVEQLTSWDGLAVLYAGRGPVLVPRAGVARVDVRTLDRKRSWVAAGAVAGVFVGAVVTALMKARSRASGDPGRLGGSPPEIRLP